MAGMADCPDRAERGILNADTSPEIERSQIDARRRMPALEKARLIDVLSLQVQALALAGIRRRHPLASERECFLRLAAIKIGREDAVRVYPDAADLFDL